MKSETAKPGKDSKKNAPASPSKAAGMTIAAGLLIFCIAAAGTLVYLFRAPLNTSVAKKPSQTDIQAPIPLVPKQTGGITVVEKMPELDEGTTASIRAPVAQGAAAAQGYAMDLGTAASFQALSRRFAAVVELNQEADLDALEPRVLLNETTDGLQARLLIGPMPTLKAAQTRCKTLILPEGLGCEAREFEGELIARNP